MAETNARQRIGVLGGTFDPIHLGHLLIAELTRESLNLQKVIFIPAAISPLKQDREPTADAKHRLEMARLAICGNPGFEVDDRELSRGGTSYTIDTLRELAIEMPDVELVMIIGADSLADFHLWREPAEICKLAFVAVLARGGHDAPEVAQLVPFLPAKKGVDPQRHVVPAREIEISSTDLRERIAQGRTTRYQLPPGVGAYIDTNRLYLS